MNNVNENDPMNQINLFNVAKTTQNMNKKPDTATKSTPLAHMLRPRRWEEFAGAQELLGRYPFLKGPRLTSMILYGPPGSGKTTLANLLANEHEIEIYSFNAVLGGVAELKKLIARSLEVKSQLKQASLFFIDEIHRFNKAQQDALLPHVENGNITLIGATTENPRVSLNKALISRVQIIELKPLKTAEINKLLFKASNSIKASFTLEVLREISNFSSGDARKAINYLEVLYLQGEEFCASTKKVKNYLSKHAQEYDRNKDRHYDVISAFIKSVRGSDPNAAILWLAVMLEGGEDPVFIARRLMILASEDIGNAEPQALTMCTSALSAVQNIGMPEARIILGQVTTYLACCPKSNASYLAINQALEFVKENPTISVPEYLKNFPNKNSKKVYQYPHNYPEHYVHQEYSPNDIPEFYHPTTQGKERFLKEQLEKLRSLET